MDKTKYISISLLILIQDGIRKETVCARYTDYIVTSGVHVDKAWHANIHPSNEQEEDEDDDPYHNTPPVAEPPFLYKVRTPKQ